MFKRYNPNPEELLVGDCTVRALCAVLKQTWEKTYTDLCVYGMHMYDMPSANHVWGAYLKDKGFTRHLLPDTCPDCYTVSDFAEDHGGVYILGTGTHVIAVINGDYWDAWDSGREIPTYYWSDDVQF